jgi:hypothetical protein
MFRYSQPGFMGSFLQLPFLEGVDKADPDAKAQVLSRSNARGWMQ